MQTVEWLLGQPLGNDRQSWNDKLIGELQIFMYMLSITQAKVFLAKRHGYGSLVSYNVPPYGQAGLYFELATLNELVNDYHLGSSTGKETSDAGKIKLLWELIWSWCYQSALKMMFLSKQTQMMKPVL